MSISYIYDFYYQLILSFYFNDTPLYQSIYITYIFSLILYNSQSFFINNFICFDNFTSHSILIDKNYKESYITTIGFLLLEYFNNKYFEEKTIITKFIQKNKKIIINNIDIINIKNIIYEYIDKKNNNEWWNHTSNDINTIFKYENSPIEIDNKIIKYASLYVNNININHETLLYNQKNIYLSEHEKYMCKFWEFTSINYAIVWILFMISVFQNDNNISNISKNDINKFDFILFSLFILSLSLYIVTIFVYNVNLDRNDMNKIVDISLYSSVSSLIFEYLFGYDLDNKLIVDKKYAVLINPYIKNIINDKINFNELNLDKTIKIEYYSWNDINSCITNIAFLQNKKFNSSSQINIIIGKFIYNMIFDKIIFNNQL